MKTLKKLLLFVVASALLAGCTSYKNVPYMQNPEVVNSYREDLPLYDAKIMPKDLLSITVNTSDPQAAAPFNLTVQTPLNAALTNINTTTQPTPGSLFHISPKSPQNPIKSSKNLPISRQNRFLPDMYVGNISCRYPNYVTYSVFNYRLCLIRH